MFESTKKNGRIAELWEKDVSRRADRITTVVVIMMIIIMMMIIIIIDNHYYDDDQILSR